MRCWRTLKVLLNTKRIFSKKYLGDFFRKPTRPSLPLKKGVLKSSRPSLPLKKAPPFSPSLSSIVFTPPSVPPVLGDRNPQGRGDVTALRCSEPLRSKVGGPKRSSPCYAGWDRLERAWWGNDQRSSPYFAGWDRRGWKVYNLQFIINSLQFRVNSLQLISREFDDKLQISFDFLGGFVEKA